MLRIGGGGLAGFMSYVLCPLMDGIKLRCYQLYVSGRDFVELAEMNVLDRSVF